MEKYNDNINIIRQATSRDEDHIKEDEYFVLMVEDHTNVSRRNKDDYWDHTRGFIGLERTSNRIYISKKYHDRENTSRGSTFIVKVNDIKKCCEL